MIDGLMRFRLYIGSFLIFWLSLIVSFMAWAAPIDDARALFVSGDYDTARSLAAQMQTAEGYTLAAESLSAQIMLGEVDKLNKRAIEARALAQKALDIDPSFYEARVQYALADGFVTRTSGNLTAWRKKLPMKTRSAIQDLHQDYPNDARVIALDAAWHLGVIRKTGETSGQKWFGASAEQGRDLYRQAIELAPQDLIIRSNYVMALLALKSEPDMVEIKAHLEDILLMVPKDDMTRKVQMRAQEIYGHLDDRKLCKKRAENFLDGRQG